MENCIDCKHSVFDPTWGEYKCKRFERRIYIFLSSSECPEYMKGSEKKLSENKE